MVGSTRGGYFRKQPIYRIARNWPLSFPEQASIDFIDVTPEGFYYQVLPVLRFPIEDLGKYVRATSHVWSHSYYIPQSTVKLARKFDAVIYMIRDPRDVVLSMVDFDFTPFRKRFYGTGKESKAALKMSYAPLVAEQWPAHVSPYLYHRRKLNLHLMFYEDLVHSLDEEIRRLLKYLGLTIDDAAIEKLKGRVRLSNMRGRSPGHVSKGIIGRWRRELPKDLQTMFDQRCGPLLRALDYPSSRWG